MTSFLRRGALFVGACAAVLAACSDEAPPTQSSSNEIADVSATSAKRQSIGNCWLYSMATWTEAMHNREAGEELDLSEAYWTYWHWFDQLTGGNLDFVEGPAPSIYTGGNWPIASEIVSRWGFMLEKDFITEDDGQIRSQRQSDALTAIQKELAPGGRLFGPATRSPDHVLAILNEVWRLSPTVIAELQATFGAGAERTFHAHATPSAPLIRQARDLTVDHGLTLADVIGESPVVEPGKTVTDYARTGTHAWRVVKSARTDEQAADALRNQQIGRVIQRTLHTQRPVYLFWAANDSHVDAAGAFRAEQQAPVATQGYFHLSVITDYEVDDVPGFGTLRAGVNETRPEALAAALRPEAKVKFFRIKNPWWGSYPKDGKLIPFSMGSGGYNDLYADYLSGDELDWRRLRSVVIPPEMIIPPPAADAGAPDAATP